MLPAVRTIFITPEFTKSLSEFIQSLPGVYPRVLLT